MPAILRLLTAATVCLAAAACAAPQTARLSDDPPPVSHQTRIDDAVFFAQKTKECGPAATAMVLTHSGVTVKPDDLIDQVYNAKREGSLTPAILSAIRRHGRIAYPIGDLSGLITAVDGGHPVLVLQNLGLQWIPQWHYAVAVGYDLHRSIITLHSGTTEFHEMPLSTFEHTWARGDHWALLVLRPGELPKPVDAAAYVEAAAGLERIGQVEAAAKAYRAATKRWSGNYLAGMGLGNALYRLGRKRAAARAYQSVTRSHPQAADAYNNLAQTLSEIGRFDDAEAAARTAVDLGGANRAIYRKTLQEVMLARGSNRTAAE